MNQTMYQYNKMSEVRIIGLENSNNGIGDRSTNAPFADSVNTYDEIYLIFVIYLCLALAILSAVMLWFVRKRWNEHTKSHQEARHVDLDCLQ